MTRLPPLYAFSFLDACVPVRRCYRLIRAAALAFVIIGICEAPLRAGEWHFATSANCADCHTQHNSSGGQPMRSDNNPAPAAHLLLRGTALQLCLSCHDGSNPAAPNVVSPVTYVPDAAGGAFPNIGGVAVEVDPLLRHGHHLNTPSAVTPPGGTLPMVLTCTTCHDPHGNASYRNLRPDPTRTSLGPFVVAVHQTVVANGSNPASVYVPSNVIYKSGLSAWCETCHGPPVAGSDHPVDRTIFGALQASYARWTSVVLPRVPVNSPTDDVIPSQDDQVNCISCHKAHGSNNQNATLFADGITIDSTCQECHNQ